MHTIENNNYRLVLASPSPSRLELLQQLGVDLEVVPGGLEEVVDESNPEAVVQTKAVMQATQAQIISRAKYGLNSKTKRFYLGLNSVILLSGQMIGRPKSKEEAREILLRLSDRTHQVMTGIAIIAPDGSISCSREITEVKLRQIHAAELDDYLLTNESLYNLGGYSLQGRSAVFVRSINGCYSNVLGVPLAFVAQILRNQGLPLLGLLKASA